MTSEAKTQSTSGHTAGGAADPGKPAIQEYPKVLYKPKPAKSDAVEYEVVEVKDKKEESEKAGEGFLDAAGKQKHDQEHAKAEEAKAKK